MGKSLDFCRKIASDSMRSTYSDRAWNTAVEFIGAEAFFDGVLKGNREFRLDGTDNNGIDVAVNVKIQFDADADFDYFTSAQRIHDGTLFFVSSALLECVDKIITASTYNKNIGAPQDGDTIEYTVGNFVCLSEYSEKFAPLDKPWLRERTTVLLPIKMTKG